MSNDELVKRIQGEIREIHERSLQNLEDQMEYIRRSIENGEGQAVQEDSMGDG